MAAFQPASAALHPASGYRLTSVASHFETEEDFLTALSSQYSKGRVIIAAFKMIHVFNALFRHQWMPVVMDSASSNAVDEMVKNKLA